MRNSTFSLLTLLLTMAPTLLLAAPKAEADARATALYRELRCMVCEAQSIADSNAELAAAMRALVREKITAGWSDAQIKTYLRERYGDMILFTPPLATHTYALWFGPLLLLLAGAFGIWRISKSSSSGTAS